MSWSSTFFDLRQKQSHVYRLNDPFVLPFSNVNKSLCLLKSLCINFLKSRVFRLLTFLIFVDVCIHLFYIGMRFRYSYWIWIRSIRFQFPVSHTPSVPRYKMFRKKNIVQKNTTIATIINEEN